MFNLNSKNSKLVNKNVNLNKQIKPKILVLVKLLVKLTSSFNTYKYEISKDQDRILLKNV